MSDGATAVVGDVLRVLVVGDSRPVDAAMDALSSQFDSISLVRERSVSSGLDRLTHLDIHCVVAPLESGSNGVAIEKIRNRDSELPVIAVIEAGETDTDAIERALEAGAIDVFDADDPQSLVAARVRNAAERYRLETASVRRDRSILERSEALVWVVDESATIEYTSAAVEPRLGYTPAELERTPLTQLVHPDDRETLTEVFEAVSAAPFGTTDRVAVRIGHVDGTWHAYELTCSNRLADPLVGGVVLTLSETSAADVGADSGVRPALERLAEPLFALGPQWELRYANAAAEQLFDADGSSSPGTVVWDLLDERVRGVFYERFLEAAASESAVEFETPYPSLETRLAVSVYPGDDGVTVYAREAPDPGAAAIDRERFDLLESVVDGLDDGVAVLEKSTIRFANAALLEATGAATLVGRELDDVFDDDLAATIRERARSSVVRWMEPVTGTITAADEPRAVDVFVTPLPDDDRTLCVVRDRDRSAAGALSAIDRSIATMADAESRPAVRQAAVDAVLAYTGADLAGWYRLEDDLFRPAAVATTAASSSVELPPIGRDLIDRIDPADGTDADADANGERVTTVLDRSELESLFAKTGIRAERILAIPIDGRGVVLATSTDPMAFEGDGRTPLAVVSRAASITLESLERGSTVRSSRAELERLEGVVARCRRLREIERTVLDSETRSEIEQSLCDALVSLPFAETPESIDLAWIGHVDTGSERITPDTWAGENGAYLESVSVSMAAAEPDHPTAVAAATLEPATVADIGDEDTARNGPEWRRRAIERGFRSVLAVPLVTDEFCYGILTVFADRPSAFDDVTREICTHLATVASHAISAAERKRALLAERLTELELLLREDDEPLSAIAHRLDRRLDVQAVIPRSSGGSTLYCTVPATDEESIRAAAADVSGVESGRLVGDRAEESLLEFVLTAPSVAEPFANHGGTLRSVLPVDDRTRLVVELPSTVDVRSFVSMVERRYAGAELVARRERDRSTRSARPFDAELRNRLSERQLRTLETAYYSGFFEWPRESTGEAVAESLGVSQPTFSRHLRLAQDKLFALLFDERDGDDEG
ncbi:bacterio-opsin activator domain-containing protein [Natronorubrum texcoconense]|uniref:PAS domain S-box-containing protein n=1 Tax=Natronorubrum texcoconense TaxID=1095776 RepID=A0A1G9FN34_9EURY|nr:bacterio-opsin activator domain-containing protein [Natronorubrum texcoconense]SDK89779.1 PAS domain S-box-containing protein [Natronorubrum texcoconense]